MSKTLWKPQPKQIEFMQRPEYEALYGGSAGGGKSDAAVMEALRQVHIPHYKALILRKTYPQLTELIDKSRQYYPRAFPKVRYNQQTHSWSFPSGAKIVFGSMHHAKDREQYQGKAFDLIIFDELTHFTWEEYSYMFSRNRPNGPGTRVYIRATTNPGGVGHGWVKQRFVDAAPSKTPIDGEYRIVDPFGKVIELKRKRIFIPATVFDNKILLDNDPNYLANLAMLPEAEQKALLYGDWNSFHGQAFPEFRDDPTHYEDMLFTHVVNPFQIPPNWKRFRGLDWGYSRPYSVGWYAMNPDDGCVYRYRELYGTTGEPNVGTKETPDAVGRKIREIEDALEQGNIIYGIADPSIWDRSRGESIAESIESHRVYFDKGENERIAGKMQVHYRFAFDEKGHSRFRVFTNNKHFIRTIPTLVYSEKQVEDVDTSTEDHIYDEFRYVCAGNPIPPRRNVLNRVRPPYDPLSTNDESALRQYGFIRMTP